MDGHELTILDPSGKSVVFKTDADFYQYTNSQTITPKRYEAGGWILNKIDIPSFSKADAILLAAGFQDPTDLPKIYSWGQLKIWGLLPESKKVINGFGILTDKCLVFSWTKGLRRHFSIFHFDHLKEYESSGAFQCKFIASQVLVKAKKPNDIRINQEIGVSPIFGDDGHENRRTFSLWCSLVARLEFGIEN